jgi:hypothetical protein
MVFSSAQISILGPTSWFSYLGIGAAQLPLASMSESDSSLATMSPN